MSLQQTSSSGLLPSIRMMTPQIMVERGSVASRGTSAETRIGTMESLGWHVRPRQRGKGLNWSNSAMQPTPPTTPVSLTALTTQLLD